MGERVRLLFVIDSYKHPYAGTEGQLLKLLVGLDKTKFEPVLAVFKDSDFLTSNPFPVPVVILEVTRMTALGTLVAAVPVLPAEKAAGLPPGAYLLQRCLDCLSTHPEAARLSCHHLAPGHGLLAEPGQPCAAEAERTHRRSCHCQQQGSA